MVPNSKGAAVLLLRGRKRMGTDRPLGRSERLRLKLFSVSTANNSYASNTPYASYAFNNAFKAVYFNAKL